MFGCRENSRLMRGRHQDPPAQRKGVGKKVSKNLDTFLRIREI